MSSHGACSARAAASRANGAKSKGPRTAAGKARSSRNALKHGLRAHRHLLLHNEDRGEFAALEAALVDDLAPAGALQDVLAAPIASAAWRMARADRMEAEILDERGTRAYGARLCAGLALIRDGNGPRASDMLLRYRGALLAELLRSLRTLKTLQAEAAKAGVLRADAAPVEAKPAAVLVFESRRSRERTASPAADDRPEPSAPASLPSTGQLPAASWPNEPEARADPGSGPASIARDSGIRRPGQPATPDLSGLQLEPVQPAPREGRTAESEMRIAPDAFTQASGPSEPERPIG